MNCRNLSSFGGCRERCNRSHTIDLTSLKALLETNPVLITTFINGMNDQERQRINTLAERPILTVTPANPGS